MGANRTSYVVIDCTHLVEHEGAATGVIAPHQQHFSQHDKYHLT